jgi:hypothetical protein
MMKPGEIPYLDENPDLKWYRERRYDHDMRDREYVAFKEAQMAGLSEKSLDDCTRAEKNATDRALKAYVTFVNERVSQAHAVVGLSKEALHALAKHLEHLNSNKPGEINRLGAYAPSLSFITNTLGPDLSGRTIVEIGTGVDGALALGYLHSLGAETIGIDAHRIPSTGTNGTRFIQGRWENIASLVPGQMVDAINIQYMEYDPEQGGPFDPNLRVPPEMRIYRNEKLRAQCKREFNQHVGQEMTKVLKKGGMVVMRHPGNWEERGDFWLRGDGVFETAYRLHEFYELHEFGSQLTVYQKL